MVERNRLPELLKEKGVTISELARNTGMSRTTLTD